MSTADPAATPLAHSRTLLSRLATRYVDGWTWYARAGYSPPAPEPGFPMARPAALPACCITLAGPPAPRFALLFGAAAGGR